MISKEAILELMEARENNTMFFYIEDFSDDGTSFCKTSKGFEGVYEILQHRFGESYKVRLSKSRVIISKRKKQFLGLSSAKLRRQFVDFVVDFVDKVESDV